MNPFADFLDAYQLRARLYPALLGVGPAIALAAFAVPWGRDGWPQVGAVAGIGIIFCAFADLARRFGKRTQKKLFPETNGEPPLTLLRYRDMNFDAKTKQRYRAWLAKQLGERAPTEAAEKADPKATDAFYLRCSAWIRERTRNPTKFKVLREENITYGFRRNLYGLRWFALALDVAVIAACLWLMFVEKAGLQVFYVVLAITAIHTAIHAAFFLFFVTKTAVLDASHQYERQLLLSCEALMGTKATAS
jgi:hypothetical protein